MNPNRITRREARVLAEEEFVRFADLVESLTPDEWARPTDCTGWDVRMIALHVLGSADAQASVREFAHQFRRGMPLNKQIDSHHWVDGLNELQIRERSHLSNDELVARLRAVGPEAVKGRWRTPPPARYLPLPFGPPIGWAPLKYLLDVGFTRDVWAHRIDIHQAIDRPMHLTADHDGRLVADIVAEWASIHGQPFELVLDGPAGGKFTHGVDGERIDIDAVEFIRTLCGRLPGTGVLNNPLPLESDDEGVGQGHRCHRVEFATEDCRATDHLGRHHLKLAAGDGDAAGRQVQRIDDSQAGGGNRRGNVIGTRHHGGVAATTVVTVDVDVLAVVDPATGECAAEHGARRGHQPSRDEERGTHYRRSPIEYGVLMSRASHVMKL